MNLLLLQPGELGSDGTVTLTDRRLAHARDVLKVAEGDTVTIGVKHGLMGTARVVARSKEALTLHCTLTQAPPPRPGIDLLLAIPRPKALKRIIPVIATLGLDRVVLLNAARVEKSYFDAQVLNAAVIDGLIDLGLEQARDTLPPTIEVRDRFKPFIEDELATWCPQAALRLVPHPTATELARAMPTTSRLVIAIGPDGGWVPFEVDLLTQHGFTPIAMGARVLRGETALPAIIAALRPGLAFHQR